MHAFWAYKDCTTKEAKSGVGLRWILLKVQEASSDAAVYYLMLQHALLKPFAFCLRRDLITASLSISCPAS